MAKSEWMRWEVVCRAWGRTDSF